MPAGAPSGLDRRFIIGDRVMRNHGLDTNVAYQQTAFDRASGVIFVAGNNDYVGLMSDGIFGPVIEGAALPASSNTFLGVALNKAAGGWVVIDGANAVFRGSADLAAAWVNITPPAVVTRRGIVEYQGNIITAANQIGGPDRQAEISSNNGAIWDSDPGIDTGVSVNMQRLRTNFDQTRLIAIFNGGTVIATTTDTNPRDGWVQLTIANPSAVSHTDVALNDAGTRAVVVTDLGDVTTFDGFAVGFPIPVNQNPFKIRDASGLGIASVVYIGALGGFILISTSGPRMAFISEANMQQMFAGSYLGAGVSVVDGCGISDGIQGLWPGSDEALCTLRRVGQLGRT